MRAALAFSLAVLAIVCLSAVAVHSTVYYQEEFTKGIKSWVQSDHRKSDGAAGKLKWAAGKWYGDEEISKGIQTSEDARFYAYSAKMKEPFNNRGKDLVFQFSVKHEQDIDCGGAYLKLLPVEVAEDPAKFNGDSPYEVMFGPDICGYSTRKIHLIFSHQGKNYLWKKEPKCETDTLTHVYTLVLHPDNTYEVYVDLEKRESGSLVDDWDMLPPRMINDPDAKKPADWVDEREIDDPEDKKPEDWDKMPEMIEDPNAKKSDDWDDEEDGEWSPPMIKNPQWKGEWKPRKIPNPDYKGPWAAPKIPNPDFEDDPELYVRNPIGGVGVEIWQVRSGTIFDNIIVTDDFDEARDLAERTWKDLKEVEREMWNAEQEAKRKKEEDERKAREAEEKKSKKGKKGGEDDEEEEEEAAGDDAEEEEEAPKAAKSKSKPAAAAKKSSKSKPAAAEEAEAVDEDEVEQPRKSKREKKDTSAAQEAKNKARRAKLEKMKKEAKDKVHDEL